MGTGAKLDGDGAGIEGEGVSLGGLVGLNYEVSKQSKHKRRVKFCRCIDVVIVIVCTIHI